MRTRGASTKRKLFGLLALLAGVVVIVISWRAYSDSGTPAAPESGGIASVHGVDFTRTTLYHSPQRPGYTSWTGAWVMPDQSIMTAFVQATGPVDPAGRGLAPQRVLDAQGVKTWDRTRDFWGLTTTVKYLSSTDGGATWVPAREDRFRSLFPAPYTPQATIGLKDGTLLRRVNGDDLRSDPSVPHTAFLQRLAPGAKDWGKPLVLMDPARFTYQISRIRYLSDGRLIATGNVWDVPASRTPAERAGVPNRFLLMVSSDGGLTWHNGLTIAKGADVLRGEWDTAQLPNGDLVALIRARQSPTDPTEVREQALLRKKGDGWVMTDVRPAPLPPSGHPELLATQEGPVLSIASTGIDYTTDGHTWKKLAFDPKFDYRSNYYPRAVQTDDGVIHVFSHVGADDPYGAVDQSITYDSFQLAPGG